MPPFTQRVKGPPQRPPPEVLFRGSIDHMEGVLKSLADAIDMMRSLPAEVEVEMGWRWAMAGSEHDIVT